MGSEAQGDACRNTRAPSREPVDGRLRYHGRMNKGFRGRILVIALFAAMAARQPQARDNVTTVRVPHGGIQPQVAVDDKGTLHLLYFAGDPSHGDLYYVRSADAGASFSDPIRVNREPGSAIAVGNVRGAQ